jgi:hypothetical protein
LTHEDDGLKQPWHGTVFLNPPYDALPAWTSKMLAEFASGRVHKLVAVLPARLDTNSWWAITSSGAATFILKRRLRFGGLHATEEAAKAR